jgi:hypothetical protein
MISGRWDKLFIGTITLPGIFIFGLGIIGICMVLYLKVHINKLVFIKKVRARKDKLFEPRYQDIYIKIEDKKTSKYLNFNYDDYGLVRSTKSVIMIEMQNHQARLSRDNLVMEPVKPRSLFGKVSFRYPKDNPEWDVFCIAPPQGLNLVERDQDEWLMIELDVEQAWINNPPTGSKR